MSIVVCAYNNWPDLELAIQSALCQSHRPIEVIVVDNASTDATADEVARRFSSAVRYVRQENRGDSGAYNTGMALARGEFVQFLDGDDVLAPDRIERQLEVFRSDPGADVVFGNVRFFRSLPGDASWADSDSHEEDIGVQQLIEREGGCIGVALAVLFRRRALERVGSWDETIYVSDSDYELRAILSGCRYRACRGDLIGFKRVRPGQMGADYARMSRWAGSALDQGLGDRSRPESARRNLAQSGPVPLFSGFARRWLVAVGGHRKVPAGAIDRAGGHPFRRLCRCAARHRAAWRSRACQIAQFSPSAKARRRRPSLQNSRLLRELGRNQRLRLS